MRDVGASHSNERIWENPMPNTETDVLKIIEEGEKVQGGFLFWGKTVNEHVGYSLQVFTSGWQYRGEADESRGSVRAQNGDRVLRISLGEFPFGFEGYLTTGDQHTRKYHAQLTLQVADAKEFAIKYHQGVVDPVGWVHRNVHAALVNWAETVVSANITRDDLRFHAEKGLTYIERSTGLRLVDVETIQLDRSPTETEIIEAIHTAEVENIKAGIMERQNIRADDHARRRDYRIKVNDAVFNAAYARLQDYLLQDRLEFFSNERPKDFQILLDSGDGQVQQLLLGTASNSAQTGTSTSTGMDTSSSTVNGSVVTEERIASLGLTLQATHLDARQQQAVSAGNLLIDQVFKVTHIDTGSRAEMAQQAEINVGDIILQVNGKSIDDISLLRLMGPDPATITLIHRENIIKPEL